VRTTLPIAVVLLSLGLASLSTGCEVNLQRNWTPAALSSRANPTAEGLYEDCQKQIRRGYYIKALELCTKLRNYYRDSPYAVLAELSIGDLHFEKTDYDLARVAYEDFMRMHPRHEKMDYVVYRLGLTSYKKASRVAARDQTWTRQAVNTWTNFDSRFPESEHVEEVSELHGKSRDRLARKELRIAEFYAGRHKWDASALRLEDMLRTYPGAEDTAHAVALLAHCRVQLGDVEAAEVLRTRLETEHPDSQWNRWLSFRGREVWQ
jgi:outer membrane protein assembly factor BamD